MMRAPRDRMMRSGRDYETRDQTIMTAASALARDWRKPDQDHAVRPGDPEIHRARDVVVVLRALGLIQ